MGWNNSLSVRVSFRRVIWLLTPCFKLLSFYPHMPIGKVSPPRMKLAASNFARRPRQGITHFGELEIDQCMKYVKRSVLFGSVT